MDLSVSTGIDMDLGTGLGSVADGDMGSWCGNGMNVPKEGFHSDSIKEPF